MKVIELFSGIGSQAKALKNIKINHKIVMIADWDIYAIISYALIHKNKQFVLELDFWEKKFFGEITPFINNERERERLLHKLSIHTFSRDGKMPINEKSFSKLNLKLLKSIEIAIEITNNHTDVKKIKGNDLPEHDLITYSFPCQDLSLQGSQKGLIEGKSSSMLWEVKRILIELNKINKLPKFLLLENVKSLFSSKYEKGFNEWIKFLEKLGYYNNIFTLNSKYYDTPQNRERAFVFSELNQKKFIIPKQDKITSKTINDVLQKEYKLWNLPKGEVFDWNPIKNKNGIAKSKILDYSTFQSEAIVFGKNSISPTITATGALNRIKVIEEIDKIRILSSLELWMLMGFDKSDWIKVSNSNLIPEQFLRKQAGNSIPIKVLEAIFKNVN